ncbi:MAG: hypothetical protein ABI641_05190 [Caldimonas sp.]
MTRARPDLSTAVLPMGEVLRSSAPLARLTERLRESKAMLATIASGLPPGLTSHVRPGPLDDEGWSLLAANAAVAAKLRQLVPRFDELLRAGGHRPGAIRIKVEGR